jgi:8-oxo-dGTP pyrophosphatase MutT (NUDIX family)
MAVKQLLKVIAGPRAQVQAAGALIFAEDTGNFLVVYRSENVVDPQCWCGAGGKIDGAETPEQASAREIQEELGYAGKMTQYPIFVYDDPKLRFYNFLGVVPSQFNPVLNWETAGYIWCQLDEVPAPLHFGLQAILDDKISMAFISRIQQERWMRIEQGNNVPNPIIPNGLST